MKIGSKLQFEVPDSCPEGCALQEPCFYQGCICTRCPVFSCKEPVTEEDRIYMPLVQAEHFRDDWASEWEEFFKTGKRPLLFL